MTTYRRKWIFIATVGLASTLGMVACSTQVEDKPKVEQEKQRDHRGPAVIVADAALDNAELTAEQVSRITEIRDRAQVDREDRSALKKELRESASEIVRDGTAGTERFDEAVDKAMAAFEERIEISSAALAEIHGLLDAEQRAVVADALRAHIDARFAKYERRKAKRKRFGKIATHLALTGVQMDKLDKAREELIKEKKGLRPSREQLDDLVDAFETDDFVAKMNAFHEDKLTLMREHVAKAGDHVDAVLTILDEDQRHVLAELIILGPKEAGMVEHER